MACCPLIECQIFPTTVLQIFRFFIANKIVGAIPINIPMKKKLKQGQVDLGESLFEELAQMIEQNHGQLVATVNSTLTILFWQVGKRINEYFLQHKRADYGKQIVVTLSRQLTDKYGSNFEEKNLRRMMQFANIFSDPEIVVTLSRQLSWSHFIILLPLKTEENRMFYAHKAALEGWGVRELRDRIARKEYERTAIADTQWPSYLTRSEHQVFKDPYLLDFLNLKNGYLEKDLESAILKELERFILEIGKSFAFIERQKRMIIDGEDHHLDLLFFHRKLKRLVAVDLKIGKFQAKDKGQMELYLKWLDRYEKQEGEEKPIGLILCAEASREQIELLEIHKDGILVAEYWTELPSKKVLEKKLHQVLIQERERIERKKLQGSE
jgi:predicted nuclease of restriction endonuclease-like (RecB) superfamily